MLNRLEFGLRGDVDLSWDEAGDLDRDGLGWEAIDGLLGAGELPAIAVPDDVIDADCEFWVPGWQGMDMGEHDEIGHVLAIRWSKYAERNASSG